MKFPQRMRLKVLLSAAVCALSLPLAAPAQAQAWPTKPVKMVVPFSPGGSTDVVARMLGQRLSEIWGQTVVIENKAARAATSAPTWWPSRPPTATRC